MSYDDEYEVIRNAAIEAFNPPDDDAAECDIVARAIEDAAAFIVAQPCQCTPELVADFQSCDRCRVLGRRGDEPISR